MKKIFLPLAAVVFLFSCENDTKTTQSEAIVAKRTCATQDVLERQLKENPQLANKMNQIENFNNNVILQRRLVNGKIEIPVVFNVLYRTAAENISNAQIQSQINVLNADFNATNADFSLVPTLFAGVKANVGITFVLDQVIRKATTKTSWGTNDAMKKLAQGGINPTSPTTKLNFWVCTIGGGTLGYAQFPGGASATDGVVCDSKYVGVTSNSGTSYPYNLGRTSTHELGHWLNLRHIWGDANCGSDLVADTPTHNASNFGVPTYPHLSTCAGNPVEMTMNYMDYTDDRGMYMFSNGQKTRINALFVSGGARFSFAQP